MINKELLTKALNLPGVGRKKMKDILLCSEQTARTLCMVRDNYDSIVSVKIGKNDTGNVLFVGDIHAPFSIDGYLEFCVGIYNKHNCSEVVFAGDLIDNHYSSYHESDADGHSAGEELKLAKEQIGKWYKAFPKAKACLGNHCILPNRKAMSGGISKHWIRPISEVLDTPNWEYAEAFVINDVLYTHGTGRKARQRAKNDLISVCQGHYHSESYIEHYVGMNYKIFALQVGCGIDKNSYAMAYGKHFNKPHINCAVILDNGQLPILEYMKL